MMEDWVARLTSIASLVWIAVHCLIDKEKFRRLRK